MTLDKQLQQYLKFKKIKFEQNNTSYVIEKEDITAFIDISCATETEFNINVGIYIPTRAEDNFLYENFCSESDWESIEFFLDEFLDTFKTMEKAIVKVKSRWESIKEICENAGLDLDVLNQTILY